MDLIIFIIAFLDDKFNQYDCSYQMLLLLIFLIDNWVWYGLISIKQIFWYGL